VKRLVLVAVVALLAAGCGGPKPTDDAADLVPPSATAFVSLQTDLGSLPQVLNRFPFGPRALKAVRRGLQLKPELGPQLDLAIFKGGMVGFTQPEDEKRFVAALGPKQVHARIRGWTAFADNANLLHLVQHHKGKLSELPAYVDAIGRLPGSAVVRAYGARGALAQSGLGASLPSVKDTTAWTSAALTASGQEVTIELHAKGAQGPASQSSAELVPQIPAGSVIAFGIGGLGTVPGPLQKLAGLDVQALVDALGGQAIAYVRAGLPFPEVTIASKPKDPEKAVREIGRLITKLSKTKKAPFTTTVDGVILQDVALGAIDIYYGTFDGLLVVSDSTDAISGLRSGGEKLKVPGLPDKTNGFLYIDVEHVLPAARIFAKLANQKVPAEVDASLKPLKTLVAYGTRDGDIQSVFALLRLR
jgi:hypothetical protein